MSSLIPRPARPISTPPTRRWKNDSCSGRAVSGAGARTGSFGEVEGVEIGAAAQHGLVGILLHHLVGPVVDHLKHDRGRVTIEECLTRQISARYLRIVAGADACLRCR